MTKYFLVVKLISTVTATPQKELKAKCEEFQAWAVFKGSLPWRELHNPSAFDSL